jgi:hypothetical protein
MTTPRDLIAYEHVVSARMAFGARRKDLLEASIAAAADNHRGELGLDYLVRALLATNDAEIAILGGLA